MSKILKKIVHKANYEVNRFYDDQILYRFYYRRAIGKRIGRPYGKRRVICSLTTIPGRLHFAVYPVLSMLCQKVRPDKVFLYLEEERFRGIELPEELRKLPEDLFEIRYVRDVKVHTKYFYAFQEYPEDLVVTVDDDMLYSPDLIGSLLAVRESNPHAVVCSRAHRIRMDRSGTFLPYESWEWDAKSDRPDPFLLPTGVGGVLYCPSEFSFSPCQEEMFLRLAPSADDLWLKAAELKSGLPAVTLPGHHWSLIIRDSQQKSLNAVNVHQNRNDLYWGRLEQTFGLASLLHENA